MDIKQLKKLINEEVARVKNKNVLEEQQDKAFVSDEANNVIHSLLLKYESLPEFSQDNEDVPSHIKQTVSNLKTRMESVSNFLEKYQKMQDLINLLNDPNYPPKELSLGQIHQNLKDPATMKSVVSVLATMGVPKDAIQRFVENAAKELQKFDVQQPKTNPGTPVALQEPEVSPTAKTMIPSVSENLIVKALARAKGQTPK